MKTLIVLAALLILDLPQQLKRIGSAISKLNRHCDEIRRHVSAAKEETSSVMEETTQLVAQREQVEAKQQLLNLVIERFSLNAEDLTKLTSPAESVDDSFFASLAKVKRVHRDCQVLLGSDDQTLGLSIMEQSSSTLDQAFERLYRWLYQQIKHLDLENPQLGSSIRRALRVLAERPSLFKDCIDYFAQSREHNLSGAFIAALTGSTSDSRNTYKPIELLAHDPLRYVGDMLAWLHATAVSEREALEVLFIADGVELAEGMRLGLDNDPLERSKAEDTESFDGVRALNDLVNRSLFGVIRLLRQRVEQLTSTLEEATLIYRVANLIHFYQSTFQRLLGSDAAILDTLGGLRESVLRQFRALLKERATAVQTEPQQAPADLDVPDFLEEALVELKEILKSYDTSLSPATNQETEFQPILKEASDPYIERCELLAGSLDAPAHDIFILNCMKAVRNAIIPFSFTSARVREIDEITDKHAQRLVDLQHAFFLHTSGLHPLVASLASLSDTEEDTRSIPSLGPFKPEALTKTSQTLDDFLPTAVLDATENLKLLQDSKLVHDVTEEAARRFCEDFEFVENKILAVDEMLSLDSESDDNEDYVPLRSLFPRTSAELRVLLS